MAATRKQLMGASAKLRLTIADLKAVDEEVEALHVNVDTLLLSQAAARISQGAKIAATAATRVLKAAKAAGAAATKAAVDVAKAEAAAAQAAEEVAAAEAAKVAAAQAAAQAAEQAAEAAQVAEAAAAAVAALEAAVKPTLPLDNVYVLRRDPFGSDELFCVCHHRLRSDQSAVISSVSASWSCCFVSTTSLNFS